MLFVVILFVVCRGQLGGLHQQLRLELVLLNLGQLRQLIDDLNVIFKPAGSDDLPRLFVALGLGNLVVLLPHVHIPGGVSGVLLAAVVEAWEVFSELLCASPDVLLPLVLPLHLVSHTDVLYEVVHQLLPFLLVAHLRQIQLVGLSVEHVSVRLRLRELVLRDW